MHSYAHTLFHFTKKPGLETEPSAKMDQKVSMTSYGSSPNPMIDFWLQALYNFSAIIYSESWTVLLKRKKGKKM